jgi:hypothetical protein
MRRTEAFEVPQSYFDDDTRDALDRDIAWYIRHQFGDAEVDRITVTVHLKTFTDDERRRRSDY